MDYMLKAVAASGLRAPSRHGTLSVDKIADRRALAAHCTAPGLLPSSRDPGLLGPTSVLWEPPMLDLGCHFQTLLSEHNQPQQLARCWSGHWDRDPVAWTNNLIHDLGLLEPIRCCDGKGAKPASRRPAPSYTPGDATDEHHRLGSSPGRGPWLNTESHPHALSGC